MLKELYIENLAVIEEATVSFCGGFNVFTGETGAGKSILIGGIKAILGGRVSKDLVRSGAEKAVITALFDTGDCEGELLILTREISSTGSSIARIGGKPVTASELRDVAAKLIDIHGQHDSHTLTDNTRQRELLDNFGGLTGDLAEYAGVFKDFSELSKKIKRLQTDENIKEEKAALLKEKIDDVNSYKLTLGEEADVKIKLERKQNAEAITRELMKARESLSTEALRETKAGLQMIAAFMPGADELLARIDSAIIELDDIWRELGRNDSVGFEADAHRLEERMSDLTRLKRKYKLDIDGLIEEADRWRDELAELEYSEDALEKLIAERKNVGDNLKRLAGEITEKRTRAAEELAALITEELIFLDMPNVRLFFALTQEKVTVTGMDGVEIMISVNKGEEPKPLGKIASGGELSRIMLAIKAVLAESDSIPTMIFDEIDTGISGRAAQKVGSKLADIAKKRQVLCVTHLASIAAKADKHLLIEKTDDNLRTFTRVADLDLEQRKRELARIISGSEDEELQEYAESLIAGKI